MGDPTAIDDGTGTLIRFTNTRNILLPGDATIKGVELETQLRPSDNFTIAASLTCIDARYDGYAFNFVQPIAGFSEMRGNQTPCQPQWSGNMAMTQNFVVAGLDAFVRADIVYQASRLWMSRTSPTSATAC